MAVKIDFLKKLVSPSERVKCVDLHPTEPLLLSSLRSGELQVWNYDSQKMVKSVKVCDVGVRAAKFVAQKNWIITGSDDKIIRVFDSKTLEVINSFEAHSDFIRSIVVHPTKPYILSSADDKLIKLWNWDQDWSLTQVFEGHNNYVMQIAINPKDDNTFASASLDQTIKLWRLDSKSPILTLEGHEKSVNCIDFSGDKPYLISGSDDQTIKIWDYQKTECIHTLRGHTQNLTFVRFHPKLPKIISGSEDGTIKIWNSNTFEFEDTLNFEMERVWTLSLKGSAVWAIGYDTGSLIIELSGEQTTKN